MIWFTSDLHFGHRNVIEYSKRPFANVEEMNQTLVKNWNAKVKDEDTVYIIGDLSLGPFRDMKVFLEQLKGHKYLIKGNHDRYSIGQYLSIGFHVYHELKLEMLGKTFRLSHYPYAPSWFRKFFAYKSELRYLDRRAPRIRGEYLIHGHTHMKYKIRDRMIHVGVDAWNYSPVSLTQIEALVAKGVDV